MESPGRIVIGIDFSETSARALQVARELAARLGSPMEVVHVREGRGGGSWTPGEDERSWLAREGLDDGDLLTRCGTPWMELLRHTRTPGAELVVVGTHGLSGAHTLSLGSNAHRLVLTCPHPVLLVGPRGPGSAPGAEALHRFAEKARPFFHDPPRGYRTIPQGDITMKTYRSAPATLALLGATLLGTACGKKPVDPGPAPVPDAARPTDTADRDAAERAAREAEEARRRAMEEARSARATIEEMVFFDFDRSDVRSDARTTLDAKIPVLRAQAGVHLRIEGHADERGSTEYNLALGMRRAVSAKDYLVAFGLDPLRFETISFGEERPLAPRHDELSWARNRRAAFVITAGLPVTGPDAAARRP